MISTLEGGALIFIFFCISSKTNEYTVGIAKYQLLRLKPCADSEVDSFWKDKCSEVPSSGNEEAYYTIF